MRATTRCLPNRSAARTEMCPATSGRACVRAIGVWQVAQENKVTLRTATFIVACKRILHAREMRGLYP